MGTWVLSPTPTCCYRVIMSFLPKRARLTFESGFQVPEMEDLQGLMAAQASSDEEEEEKLTPISPCSCMGFSFQAADGRPRDGKGVPAALLPTPTRPSTPNAGRLLRRRKAGVGRCPRPPAPGGPAEQQRTRRGPDSAALREASPQSPSPSTSWATSGSQEKAAARCLQKPASPEPWPRDPLEQKVTDLVKFMILKYQSKEPISKAEMLKGVSKSHQKRFPVIFQKASKCLEVIAGIDVKEVDPVLHSYVLVNSLGLTCEEKLGDKQGMPKHGFLLIILGAISIAGNCIPEEDIWDFLNVMGVYAGREHFLYGEPRQLLTRDWVQQKYLEYRQVPRSDPPRYEFLWGSRAHAETNKMKVLEFLAKIKGTDPISFSCWYEEALRDEEERARASIEPRAILPTTVTEQQGPEASPAPAEG
ncbi:PREDICTED: melanoma-associated antigen 9-like [Condylura cristata]|uniref:melanoma-associated antigen 9-like n=1 Tax=Condylura cristata TaxID=143302 RepID=UPI00033475C4|nr:PREDICTED: melanoma-associated antigen 9-like [Condylura cristata]